QRLRGIDRARTDGATCGAELQRCGGRRQGADGRSQRLASPARPLALGVVELESPPRRGEVLGQLGLELVDLVAELAELELEPALTLAFVRVRLALERGAAVGAGHVAGREHVVSPAIGPSGLFLKQLACSPD